MTCVLVSSVGLKLTVEEVMVALEQGIDRRLSRNKEIVIHMMYYIRHHITSSGNDRIGAGISSCFRSPTVSDREVTHAHDERRGVLMIFV